jgi:hypothetical protein
VQPIHLRLIPLGRSLEPENAHLHYDLGLAYKLKDNLASAITEFERSSALDATLPDPPYSLGVIYSLVDK